MGQTIRYNEASDLIKGRFRFPSSRYAAKAAGVIGQRDIDFFGEEPHAWMVPEPGSHRSLAPIHSFT
jgi:hypothetical protein